MFLLLLGLLPGLSADLSRSRSSMSNVSNLQKRKRDTRRKYVSAGNGASEVFPTRIKMTRTKDQNVHDIGSKRQQHLKQFPQLTILDSEQTLQPQRLSNGYIRRFQTSQTKAVSRVGNQQTDCVKVRRGHVNTP